MEREAGGNSRSGENEITLISLGRALHPGSIQEYDSRPRAAWKSSACSKNGEWNERYLCYSPQERLYLHGRWQEDIEPVDGNDRQRS